MIRRWLDNYKVELGCVDCGYRDHHAALHFDHVRGEKTINVCNAKSIEQARREIVKCEVRCANCHAVKTFTRYSCKPEIVAATYEAVAHDATDPA
jgi:TnpA family transposase